jgi:hypothetical protein
MSKTLSTKGDPVRVLPRTSNAVAGKRADTRLPGAGSRLAISLVLALSTALTGCHLLDQSDFRPKPAAPPPPPPPVPDPEQRTALVTIDFAKANPDYAAALATAIHAAETQRPGVLYDVVWVAGDNAAALAGRSHAAEVMVAIEADGVIPARIQLGLRVDPGRKVPQVRVYLR